MNLLFFSLLAIFPFGQLGRFQLTSTIAIHLIDLFAFLLAFFWLILVFRTKKIAKSALDIPLVSFTFAAVFSFLIGSLAVGGSQLLEALFYLIRWGSYAALFLVVIDFTRKNKKFFTQLPDALLVIGASTAIFGIVQYFWFPDVRLMSGNGWDPHYYRLVGTFLDPGFTGIILVFFTLLVFSRKWGGVGRWLGMLLFFLGVVTVALTFSRASYLALVVGMLSLYIVRRNFLKTAGALFFFFILVSLIPKPGGEGVNLARTSTVVKRLSNYEEAVKTAKTHPLFGVGFNFYRYKRVGASLIAKQQVPNHSGGGADSSLLFVLATTGVVGLIAFMGLWWKLLSIGWVENQTVSGLALFASTVSLFAHSLFDNSLFYPWVLVWIAILAGVCCGRSKGYIKL
ncbi:MAG: O-antigen ligase family protein [Candidatus Blackburnbacteria bacterium]|nr:O-antigen ligase family protein [Candidatus Blackburnbacteria bacterium]